MEIYNNSLLKEQIDKLFYLKRFNFSNDIGKVMFENHIESLINRLNQNEEIEYLIDDYDSIKKEISKDAFFLTTEIERIIFEIYNVNISEIEKILIATHIQTEMNKGEK